jgi:hypothetical protein
MLAALPLRWHLDCQMLVQQSILASSIKHLRSVMTTTDSPTTTADQVQSATERSPRRHSEGTPTDRVDWWSRGLLPASRWSGISGSSIGCWS